MGKLSWVLPGQFFCFKHKHGFAILLEMLVFLSHLALMSFLLVAALALLLIIPSNPKTGEE